MASFLTMTGRADAEYSEKRSRFLAAAVPCASEEEAARLLADARAKYWDARHNVYAYSLHDGTSRFSDDGEPHGTAGKPVLDAISGSGMTDVMVIVTRYFGGVLLGTGGLVRAYSTAARDALREAQMVEMCPCTRYTVVCPYPDHALLMRVIADHNGAVCDTAFAENVTVDFSLREGDIPEFLTALRETFSARLSAKEEEIGFSAFPFEKNRGITDFLTNK